MEMESNEDGNEIELVDLVGFNVATGQKEKAGVYCVNVNGLRTATIGWKSSKLQFNTRTGPIEAKRIQATVKQLLERDIEIQLPPDVPEEMLTMNEESTDDSNDFDA